MSISLIFLRMELMPFGKVFDGNCRMVLDLTIFKIAFTVQSSNTTSTASENPQMINVIGPTFLFAPVGSLRCPNS